MVRFFFLNLFFLFSISSFLLCQDYYDNEDDEYYDDVEILEPINDSSLEGQLLFVSDLLDLAGYVPEKIEVYQTLPNKAHVFRVKLDSIFGGFIFVRWNKKTKENYIANKLIDPGLYYSLKAAKQIMVRQTDKATFTKEDIAIQAPDQQKINERDIEEFREEFKVEERERIEKELEKKSKIKPSKKFKRKLKKKLKKKGKDNL
tara:strand:+ start:1901 stop:2509 length:609 start_codon:yes stop_codon:yes gene_type:complete